MKQIPLESLKQLKEADEILLKHFPEKSGLPRKTNNLITKRAQFLS
jgi:hypothetical protein